jgi:AP-1 complex subunit gamma-1
VSLLSFCITGCYRLISLLLYDVCHSDFTNSNPYIVGLALCALGNICTGDMARDLSNEVEKFFRNSNPYIRKKAALCAVRLVRKAPELVEEYVPGANGLLNDSNHAVQLSGIQLVIDMVKLDPSCVGAFRKVS